MNLFSKPAFLSPEQMQKVHESSLYLLKNKGVVFRSEKARKILEENGATVKGEIVYFPESMVERCMKLVPSSFRVDAINPERSVQIGGDFIIHPCGGEVFLKDANNTRYNSTTIKDFSDLQKIHQACENMNMTGYQPLSPADVPMATRGLHCLYETMLYTDKPWLAPMDYSAGENKVRELNMYEIVFGSDFVRNHYLTWSIVTPESPLTYSQFSCESIMEYASFNQPVALVSAPMSGITGPFHLLGTVVLANAESLAGMVLAECVKPGIPLLPSASLTYGNLQYAAWECASPDSTLMLGTFVQMWKDFYKLPVRAQTGVTSSKLMDYQAGYETMQSLLLTALMDVDVTSQSEGSLENLMTLSFEKTVIDDEVVSRVRHIIDGMKVTDETLSVDIIMDVDHGDNFIMHDSTLDNFASSWQPAISDWANYEVWSTAPYQDIEKKAEAKVKAILASAEQLLEPSVAQDLKTFIAKYE